MQALLIVAHGSRRVQSNDEIRALAAKVGEQSGTDYAYVGSAFLELAEPSIPDGIQHCIDQGATVITIMPFFLSAGRHVVTDVPELVQAKQRENPQVKIRMAPYLGVSGLMPGLIVQSAQTACECNGANCTYPACITG
ncbi:CbiX protein [Thiothrix caldifontis]|uniref:CbiX protein n=1 Tax=Thiothrix caldifontis TaxID=525918 RepID=A0A1H4E660_9GAMM|nr:CbiX/SirB N-terminal domain-containing protein [Thiothrix caldifontis]SEA80564.1 CbiX protein [Thiothrix caldifontis]